MTGKNELSHQELSDLQERLKLTRQVEQLRKIGTDPAVIRAAMEEITGESWTGFLEGNEGYANKVRQPTPKRIGR